MDCEQPVAIRTPPPPVMFDPVQWTAWARAMFGQVEIERTAWAGERKCIRELKRKGVIR